MSAYIIKRQGTTGPRWFVRYRTAGRMSPLIHCGSFKTKAAARKRQEWVVAQLAIGNDPRRMLDAQAREAAAAPNPVPTLAEWFERFTSSRIDVTVQTEKVWKNSQARLGALADRDPFTLVPADFQQWIAVQVEGTDDVKPLSSASVKQYLSPIRQTLEFAGVEPNPASSTKLWFPREDGEELSPPSGAEWLRISEHLEGDIADVLELIEAEGLRVGEACALTYGDLDVVEQRFRVSKARTKRKRGGTPGGQRWLAIPDELLDKIDARVPFEDRTADRRIFPNLTDNKVRHALYQACKQAGTAAYSPHDLRHRRISLWVRMGIDPVTVSQWAGHLDRTVTLETYSHVILDGVDRWHAFWRSHYEQERLRGVADAERLHG